MKKISLFCATLSLFFQAQAAEQGAAIQNLDSRLTRLETELKHAANSPSLPVAGPFFQADLLFWQARENGLAYAVIASAPLVLDLLPSDFEIKEPEFEWDFGFRVGLGYGGKSDGWDIGAQWTRFFTDAHDLGTISSQKFFLPVWAHPNFNAFGFDPIRTTDAHWKLHFNKIDAGIGRGFYVTKYFTARPFAGPSAIWIHQHYHIEYDQLSLGPIPALNNKIHLRNAFFGIGVQVGCDLNFHLTRPLSLFTRGSGAIYAGHFEIRRKETFRSLTNESFKLSHNLHAGRAAVALEMGFAWEHAMQDSYYIRAELCYDIHYFFKQNQMPRVISHAMSPLSTYFVDQGDLALHGGSFSVRLGF
jgi:hypothetical protein